MDPITISLVAMTCSIIIAATNFTMCSMQSYAALNKASAARSNEHQHHKLYDENDHHIELTGKEGQHDGNS